jgi:hypothetical protein
MHELRASRNGMEIRIRYLRCIVCSTTRPGRSTGKASFGGQPVKYHDGARGLEQDLIFALRDLHPECLSAAGLVGWGEDRK